MTGVSIVRNPLGLVMTVIVAAPLGCIDGRAVAPGLGPGCEEDDAEHGDDRAEDGDPSPQDGPDQLWLDTDALTDGETDGGGVCVPANCEALELTAGLWEDGCGGVLDCGDWVSLAGGAFWMGDKDTAGSSPEHLVTVPAFEMWRTEVTIEEYAVCSNSGGCDEPATNADDQLCYWGDGGDDQRPVNCVTWHQAREFCEFAGGRLPSEAEWEFAARSAGEDARFPWGDEKPDCTRAVMVESGVGGCGMGTAWPVCSRPSGNSNGDLCDMAGNLIEWIEDDRHMGNEINGGYDLDGDGVSDAPTDGSAWIDNPRGLYRMQRGGSYQSTAVDLTNRYRSAYNTPAYWAARIGFRCAKDPS